MQNKELKVSVQTGNWYDRLFNGDERAEEAFAFIKECGFDTLDYNIDHTLSTRKFAEGEPNDFYDADVESLLERYRPVKEAMERQGIFLGQAHAPFPLYFEGKDEINDYLIMVVEKECAICQYLGCPALVVHPYTCDDKEEERRINLEMYRKMIPAGKKYGVTLCLENMFRFKCGHAVGGACSDAAEACWYIDKLNAEAGEKIFGYCYDVGHANLLHRDLRQDIKLLGDRLTVLHIHDNDAAHDLHQIPYTQRCSAGQCTDWEAFIDGLRSIGYKGTLNFETFAALENIPEELIPGMLKLIAEVGLLFKQQLITC